MLEKPKIHFYKYSKNKIFCKRNRRSDFFQHIFIIPSAAFQLLYLTTDLGTILVIKYHLKIQQHNQRHLIYII